MLQALQYVVSPLFSPVLIRPVYALNTKLASQLQYAWRGTNWRQQQDEPAVAWQGAVHLIDSLERAWVGSNE